MNNFYFFQPFKEKEKGSIGGDAKRLSVDDDDDDDEDELFHNNKSGFKKLPSSAGSNPLPIPTNLVPDGKEFNTGDFMVLKSDAERDSAPIWR